MIHNSLTGIRDEIPKSIQSKLDRNSRSLYRPKIHNRRIRSMNNTTITSNQTKDQIAKITKKPFTTIPKDFRIEPITLKPLFLTFQAKLVTLQFKTAKITPYSKAPVGLTLPKLIEIIAPPPVLQLNCEVKADSCSNRCTKETHFVRYFGLSTGQNNVQNCNCDSACNDVFVDCCSDFATQCSKYDVNDQTDNVNLYKSSWRCETKLMVSMNGCSVPRGIWMISRCPRHWKNDDTVEGKCHRAPHKLDVQSYDSLIPVVGTLDQLTYRNQYCAKCNNVSDFEFMTLIFKKQTVPPPYFTPKELNKFIAKNIHNFEVVKPREGQKLRLCYYPDVITSCPAVLHGARDSCVNGTVGLVQEGGNVFKNKDCALCNGEKYTCGVGSSTSPCSTGPKSIHRAISLRDYGVSLETNSCSRNRAYDPYLSKCREIYEVAELKKNDTNKYQVFLSALKLERGLYYRPRGLVKEKIAEYFKMNESQIVIENTIDISSEYLIVFTLDLTPAQSLIVASDPEFSGNSNVTIGLRRLFKFHEAFELAFTQHDRCTVYRLRVRQMSCIHQHVYKREEYTFLEDLQILVNATGAVYTESEYYLNTTKNATSVTVCLKLLPSHCNGSYIKLNTSEYRLFDNLTLSYRSLMYAFGDYYYKDGTVLICVQFQRNYTTSHKREPEDDLALIVLTWLGFILSIIGLSALLLTYIVFRELRTLPGKNLMTLSISLCLADIFWLGGSMVTANETACTVIAIANHYFFLVFFAASSVIAFHSYLIFGKRITFRRSASEDKTTFLVYSLVSWCFPAVFVLIFGLLDHHGVFATDYGKSDICWLGTRESKLFLFIVPFGVLLLFNLFLFSFVALRLYKNRKSSEQSLGKLARKQQTRNILVCIKLSTLMGFSWLFGLLQIAVEIETNIFAYLFVIFVSFQGLFICVAFLLKRNCYRLYRSLISNSLSSSTSRNVPASATQRQEHFTHQTTYQETKL